MIREPIIMACTCEIAGRVRGKGFPAADLPSRLEKGVGWVPTNTMISALGPIADTPFGATGDMILVPDPTTEVNVDFGDGSVPERWFLGDIRLTDGTPWECCPREFLRRALRDLDEAAGLQLFAAFEHEFVYSGVEDRPGAPYSLDLYRRQGGFGETLLAAMRAAGVEPDSFLPEYGARQFEVTCAPALGMKAADDAVKVREMARAVAIRLGHRATFSPILDPEGTGSGVHIHFSFRDRESGSATYDPARPFMLTETAGHFMAGILAHLPAIAAITAPSPVSYIRLRPDRWAPTWGYIADRDREASLRICPVVGGTSEDARRRFNVEFRPADAAASPYLALGVLVHAGVDGIRRRLKLPDLDGIAAMDAAEREAAGIRRLPQSLAEALDELEADAGAKNWFGAIYLDAYLRHKRAEIGMVAGLDERAQCDLYAESY
ncbi:glutamine synthetase [Faunimonas pinastri]|uniref:Glutamine synthetase n=1 Tax=Faunimonas pinastri TaxID=1855383 RepID=A0A1H9PFV4_9HYPH|nr:glutamine synthetase family protein [Faunimonas pinastri]SER47176.1 glutamine synthetase [Faunimonas pinastri]